MNARVVLLVVVTGLFMTAWDGDQVAMQAAIARRSQKLNTQLASKASQHDSAQSDSQQHALTSVKFAAKADQDSKSAASCCKANGVCPHSVPLPVGIAAGTYKAVNQAGDTVEVTVPEEKATGKSTREFYMADSADGDRWYLIRIVR